MGKGIARLAVPALIAIASSCACVAPASAEYAHPMVNFEFGKEGPAASGTGSGCRLAYQQANKRLYLLSDSSVYGLDVSAPGAATLLPGFPFNHGLGSGCGDPGLAVDNSNGSNKNNIYVTPSNQSIYGFNSNGSPLGAPWPVNAGGETCGVAVTNNGEVWGGNYGSSAVSKFSTGGVSIGNFALGYRDCKLAVDQTNNDLYVANYGGGPVTKYAAPGYAAGVSFPSGGNPGLAINGSKDRIYIASGASQVLAYNTETGDLIETIEVGGSASGVAVNEENDTVWVTAGGVIKELRGVLVPKATTGEPTANSSVSGSADPDGTGDITECSFEYGAGFASTKTCDQALPITTPTAVSATLPGLLGEQANPYRLVLGNANGQVRGAVRTITPHNVKGLKTEPATAITRDGAEFHASFEGDGTQTYYYFEWGETTNYGSKSATPPGTSAGTPTFPPLTDLSFSPTGLKPDTTYHFRVVAENASGISPGQDRSFQTLSAVQSLTTLPASDVGGRTATLNASYVGDGDPTTYYFEYGPTAAYGTKTPITAAVTAGTVPLSAGVEGLSLDTEYHYRVVATNSLGTTKGVDQTFFTEKAVKGLTTLAATDISLDSVTLNGEYLGNGEPTSYWFEYGPTTSYGEKTETVSAGEGVGVTPFSIVTDQFEGFTTYHVRVVAENPEGTTFGNDLTFETPDALLPEISAVSGSALSPTVGQVQAQINPNRWKTVYRIQYGTNTDYGSFTPLSEIIGSDFTTHPVAASVPGLQPGTTYHLRVVAINFAGTTHGPDIAITTPDVPSIESSSASSVTQTTVRLGALVVANSSPTTVRFEYGPSSGYGATTAPVPAGSGSIGESVGVDLAGLTPGTTYHARAVAVNGIGTGSGQDITFTTAPASSGPPVTPKPPKKCKKGFVKKKNGKCVKKKKQKRKGKSGR